MNKSDELSDISKNYKELLADHEKLKQDYKNIRTENEKLTLQLKAFELQKKEHEKNYSSLNDESLKTQGMNQNKALVEQKFQTELRTWQQIVDEMAHTINTDIFIATDSLLELDDNDITKKIYAHLTEVRDLTDLTLWFLRKNELIKDDEQLVAVDLREVLQNQIKTIQAAPSTLRLATKKHRENLKVLNVEIESAGTTSVQISSEIKKVFNLLFKDLLKNAFKNTTEDKPIVKVNISEQADAVTVSILNNELMPEEFLKWLTQKSSIELEISKHSKAGLRILKKWTDFLNVNLEIKLNDELKSTTVSLKIPNEISLKGKKNVS